MKQIYVFFCIILLFTSCSPHINYLGSTSEPTSQVDVFVDESAIKKGYDIIGKGYVDARIPGKHIPEKIQTKAIEKAMTKGADAILIQDYVANAASSLNTTTKKDNTRDVLTVNNIKQPDDNAFIIYFLKYTK